MLFFLLQNTFSILVPTATRLDELSSDCRNVQKMSPPLQNVSQLVIRVIFVHVNCSLMSICLFSFFLFYVYDLYKTNKCVFDFSMGRGSADLMP